MELLSRISPWCFSLAMKLAGRSSLCNSKDPGPSLQYSLICSWVSWALYFLMLLNTQLVDIYNIALLSENEKKGLLINIKRFNSSGCILMDYLVRPYKRNVSRTYLWKDYYKNITKFKKRNLSSWTINPWYKRITRDSKKNASSSWVVFTWKVNSAYLPWPIMSSMPHLMKPHSILNGIA